MNLLPQVSPEDLNQGNLQRWDLAMHEDSSQIKLHLETDIDLDARETNLQCRKTQGHPFPGLIKKNESG